MVRARRQAQHDAIAQALENRFPDTAPELLAQQFQDAGRNEKAVQYWQRAGDRDMRRFAMKESISHYSNALRLVTAMPETPERDSTELGIRLGFGLAQMIAIGPTAKEVAEHYRRALVLSSTQPHHGRERFLATWGVWLNAVTGERGAEAKELAEELVTIARELDDSDLLLEAYHAKVPMLLRTPDYAEMKQAAQEVIRLYNRERHRDHAYYFGGHDSRVCAQCFYGISLWGLGFPNQAQQMGRQAVEDARALGHTFTLAHCLNIYGMIHLLLNDVNSCRAVIEELYPIAERNKFIWPLALARLLRGWLTALDGDRNAGIEQIIKLANEKPNSVLQPILLAVLAQQQMAAGYADAARVTLDRAVEETAGHQNRFYEAEIMRVCGETLLMQAPHNKTEAEATLREALAIARRQACHPLELRAATSVARLLRDADACSKRTNY
jgi:predicted ATPase